MNSPAGLRSLAAPTSATIALATVALLHAGCGAATPNTADVEPSVPAADVPPPPVACGEAPSGERLSQFAGQRCPWTLVAEGGGVRLSSAEPEGAVSFVGSVPQACAASPCAFRGVSTAVGPLVVVEQPGLHSELPQGVWMGHAAEDELRFIDLWQDAGDDVFDGGVALGPAHALAPFDCKGTLAWFAAARTVAGESIDPPPSLRSREGPATETTAAPLDRTTCTPLPIDLP